MNVLRILKHRNPFPNWLRVCGGCFCGWSIFLSCTAVHLVGEMYFHHVALRSYSPVLVLSSFAATVAAVLLTSENHVNKQQSNNNRAIPINDPLLYSLLISDSIPTSSPLNTLFFHYGINSIDFPLLTCKQRRTTKQKRGCQFWFFALNGQFIPIKQHDASN